MELAGISFNCFHPLLKYIADIDQQVGFMVPVLQILEIIFRAPFFLFVAGFILCFNFNQTGQETGVIDKLPGAAMIRVAIAQDVANYNFRLVLPDRFYHLQLMSLVIAEKTISHPKVFPYRYTNDIGCIRCFLVTGFYISSCAEFTLCQIYNTYFFSSLYFIDQGAGATKLNVVGMNANGKYVKFHYCKIMKTGEW